MQQHREAALEFAGLQGQKAAFDLDLYHGGNESLALVGTGGDGGTDWAP